jgi:hypothetical protein
MAYRNWRASSGALSWCDACKRKLAASIDPDEPAPSRRRPTTMATSTVPTDSNVAAPPMTAPVVSAECAAAISRARDEADTKKAAIRLELGRLQEQTRQVEYAYKETVRVIMARESESSRRVTLARVADRSTDSR